MLLTIAFAMLDADNNSDYHSATMFKAVVVDANTLTTCTGIKLPFGTF